MAQRPVDKHKVYLGSTFRVLESPHPSPCLSYATPNAGYSFHPPPMAFTELPPSAPSGPAPTAQVPAALSGGIFDLLSGAQPQCETPKPRPVALGPAIAIPAQVPTPSSPVFARQMSPMSPAKSPCFSRQFSPPSSPAWTTVPARRKVPNLPGGLLPAAEEKPVEPPVLQRLPTTGDSVDLYYDQKEVFVRGWTKEAKATRSVKQKKRVDYQVEKRRQQSERDRAAMMGDGDDDAFFD